METFKYLIVGGGMTADSAARGIRMLDTEGRIGMFSSESYPPYGRPPLSKGLWKGRPIERIWRNTEARYKVELLLDRTVMSIDPAGKTVTDNLGNRFGYEKLLLATGGEPRRLPFNDEGVIYLKTLADYYALRAHADTGNEFVVIGGGFTGSEIAASLAQNGKKVTLVFSAPGINARVLPADLSAYVTDYFRQQGVTVLAGERAAAIETRAGKTLVTTTDGQVLSADAVVAGIGIAPSIGLAEAAGLETGDGIRVDPQLRTSHPDIYAAGDVANFYNPALDRRMRAEHEDNSNSQGKQAGRNMAGANEPYDYLPFFYSDLFDLGYEAIGEIDARMEIETDWIEPNRKGVIYYLRDRQVRGVLLWNMKRKLDEARALIESREQVEPGSLRGRITPAV